jgi:AcrR family transcriptional regulator
VRRSKKVAQLNHTVAGQRPGIYSRGEDTRRRILEAAVEVFAAEGYEGTSTRHLAERAGINLPAIQYYFGSKDGLYRAAIDYVIQEIEAHFAPIAAPVRAALARDDAGRAELLEALCQMLEAFVALIAGGSNLESRRLLFARAEIEETAGLDALHECGMRQMYEPCLSLVTRLVGQSGEVDEAALRTLLLIGQVTVFCNKGTRRALKATEFSEAQVRAIQRLVRLHAEAIFAVPTATQPHPVMS